MKIRIRRLLVPVFWLLAVACLIELPLGQTTIFGEDVILWDTLFRAVAASPVLIHFYREDAVFRGKERWGWKEAALWAAAGFGLSLLGTLAVQVLSRAGLQADMSMVEENLLSGPLWAGAYGAPGGFSVSGGDLFPGDLIPAAEGADVCEGGGSGFCPGIRPVPWDSHPGDLWIFHGTGAGLGHGKDPDGESAGGGPHGSQSGGTSGGSRKSAIKS